MSKEILDYLASKSCSNAGISLDNNPNLEARRQMSDGYIDMLVDTSRLMQNITVKRVDGKGCRGEFRRLDMCEISSSGACNPSCPTDQMLEDSYITYDLQKYRTHMNVDQDMIDCGDFGDQIMPIAFDMLRKRIRIDMENAAIRGDEDLPTGDGQSRENNLFGINDGFLKIACNCVPQQNIIDAKGMGPSSQLFQAARRLIPTRYKTQRGQYQFIVGPTMNDWWVEEISKRPTDKGDEACETGIAPRIFGSNFFEVPQWPENFLYGTDGEVTHILYTPLDNLVYVVKRELEFETERRISCDDYISYGWWYADFIIQEPEKVILIKNVDLENCNQPFEGCIRRSAPNVCNDVPPGQDIACACE